MFRRKLRLRGIHSLWVVILRRDLRAGEEPVRFTGNLIPDLFDPSDPFSVNEAMELCRALASHARLTASSAPEQRAQIESYIQRALELGELVMISSVTPVDIGYLGSPRTRGMGTAWEVGTTRSKFWFLRREHMLRGDTVVRVADTEKIVDAVMAATDPESLTGICELLRIAAPRTSPNKGDIRDLRYLLARAFRAGELVVVRGISWQAKGWSTASEESSGEPRVTTASPPKETHWIEIELVGEDGEPIPWESYRIELPTGVAKSGRLDQDGWARVDGIPSAGTCLVAFPNLDRDAWDGA